MAMSHPAVYTTSILLEADAILREQLPNGASILDPFAGVGLIHQLTSYRTFGVELEPEWADQHPDTLTGDATSLPFRDNSFDAIVTSPAYGNRMADSYDGRDGSKRRTYRTCLQRPLSDHNGASMQWGDAYRWLHGHCLLEMERVTKPGGLILVNMKNHIRKGNEQLVVEWWVRAMMEIGLGLVEVRRVDTPGYGFGANGHLRVDGEMLIVTRKVTQ